MDSAAQSALADLLTEPWVLPPTDSIVALAVVALTSGTLFTHALLAGSLTQWLGHDGLVKGHASCWQHTG
jgi:hypothetical protein